MHILPKRCGVRGPHRRQREQGGNAVRTGKEVPPATPGYQALGTVSGSRPQRLKAFRCARGALRPDPCGEEEAQCRRGRGRSKPDPLEEGSRPAPGSGHMKGRTRAVPGREGAWKKRKKKKEKAGAKSGPHTPSALQALGQGWKVGNWRERECTRIPGTEV